MLLHRPNWKLARKYYRLEIDLQLGEFTNGSLVEEMGRRMEARRKTSEWHAGIKNECWKYDFCQQSKNMLGTGRL